MQITIRGHHLTITPAIEQDIRFKFNQLTQHLDQVNSMQVKLSKDHEVTKRSKKVVLTIRLKRLSVYLELSYLHRLVQMICILLLKNYQKK